MRGLCRKSRRLVDVSSMWAILEAELNKANTFNVCSHGEYFDEDCKPFRFRTLLLQEKRELALEIRKLSSDECTKVVHIVIPSRKSRFSCTACTQERVCCATNRASGRGSPGTTRNAHANISNTEYD